MRILVVDDDSHIRQLIAMQLKQGGYEAIVAQDAQEALHVLETEEVAAAIVDVMMPGMDGYQLTRVLSDELDIPVILVTAKDQLEDKVKGFESGSEDYLVKPFEPQELLFRVHAILRRYRKATRNIIHVANLQLNRETYDVVIGDQTLLLPMKEFELLVLLANAPGSNVSRVRLLEEVWGEDDDRHELSLNTHINRLRERLKKHQADVAIHTVRGIGYRLEVLR